jgi:ABC-type enterobactin transport system permease subunit
MASMQTAIPARKVIGSALGAATATIVLYVLNTHVLTAPVPAEVGGALTTVVTFMVGYYLPPAPRDQVRLEADEHA